MIPEKSMMIVNSFREGAPTFRMYPLSLDCPYGEAVYVPQVKALVIFHKHTVEGLHMFPKLDDNGDAVRAPKKRANGSEYKEERKSLATAHETYLVDKQDIENFINLFARNTEFDYAKYMVDSKIIQPEQPKIIMP